MLRSLIHLLNKVFNVLGLCCEAFVEMGFKVLNLNIGVSSMFQLFILFDLNEFGWVGKKFSLLVASCFSLFV
jgi:hypothetical protein